MCIKIIIGLGNKNKELFNTRHNIGTWFIYKFLKKKIYTKIKLDTIYNVKTKKKNIYFYIPKSYINNSSKKISTIKKKLNIKNKEILFVHDEINLKPGHTKITKGAKNCTHNGIKDIIKNIKLKNEFYRLRIGIGKNPQNKKLQNFVLSPPTNYEKYLIKKSINKSIKYIKILIKHNNFKKIQNILNTHKYTNKQK